MVFALLPVHNNPPMCSTPGAADKWKAFVQKKKKGRTTISSIVDQVMAAEEHVGLTKRQINSPNPSTRKI